jgi:RecA-family ATPase
MLSDDLRLALLADPDRRAKQDGERIRFRCPRHADHTPSAWMAGGAWGCFACDFQESITTLAPELGVPLNGGKPNGLGSRNRRKVATYTYTDAEGRPVYFRDRFEWLESGERRKEIIPRQLDGSKLGNPPVPYRLHELLQAKAKGDLITFVEGEKPADALAERGYVATTTGSCSSWKGEYAKHFLGARIAIWPDADPEGERYAVAVATALEGIAAEIRVVRFPNVRHAWDAADYFDEDGTPAELNRILDNAPPWHPNDSAAAEEQAVPPLFVASEIQFRRFLDSEAPPRRMILDNVLPLGVAGLLASMGGAGKSALIYQLAISIAGRQPFLGMQVREPGSVLYVAAEDDEGELHRRGLILLAHHAPDARTRELIGERLHVVSRVAADNLMTASSADGEVRKTAFVERLIEAALPIPNLRLIALDPVSRFRGGRANHEEDATRFVEANEAIREATGATVLGLAHVSQAGIKEGGGQEIVRGSTALVDGVRWVATLQRLQRKKAMDYGLREEEADRYLRFEIPKSNYTPPFPGLWLRREAGGMIVPCELEERTEARQQAKAEGRYSDVVERLQELLLKQGPMTRNRIRSYCGRSGLLGAGDQTVRSIIERALQDGSLFERPRGKDVELHPPAREDDQ